MQMQQVRYFLALCELRSFTQAAKRCGVSQPSLTTAIAALEREVGGLLFQRRPLVTLTDRGYTIQPYLRRVAENADLAVKAARVNTRDETERMVRQLLRQRPAQAGRLGAPDRLTDRRRRHSQHDGSMPENSADRRKIVLICWHLVPPSVV
jgi:DNA-binding transcriptional LysR family regulator